MKALLSFILTIIAGMMFGYGVAISPYQLRAEDSAYIAIYGIVYAMSVVIGIVIMTEALK